MNSRHQDTLDKFESYHIWVDELDHDKHWQLGYGGAKEKPVIKMDYWPTSQTLMWGGMVRKMEPDQIIKWLLADKFVISDDRIRRKTNCQQCGIDILIVDKRHLFNSEKDKGVMPVTLDGLSHFHKDKK